MATTPAKTLDTQELEDRVKEMYREVAEEPHNEFHFETGRDLAVRLLHSRGVRARRLDVGFPEWQGAGFPVEIATRGVA